MRKRTQTSEQIKMKTKAIAIIFLIFISFMGVIFSSLLFHELFHIVHLKGSHSICIGNGMKINDDLQEGYLTMYTITDISQFDNVEEYQTTREFSEKVARIIENSIGYLFAILTGITISTVFIKGQGGKK